MKDHLHNGFVSLPDDEAPWWPARIITGQRWNGWAIPGFTRETAQEIADYLNALRDEGDVRCTWSGDELFVTEHAGDAEGGYTERAGPDDGLYWIGAYAWCWFEKEVAP